MGTVGIVLMGHGSRDREGSDEFASLVDAVRRAAPGYTVEGGVLEFAGPAVASIAEAVDRCAARRARSILMVPVLLHHAGHNKHDMPAEVARARARNPGVDVSATAAVGSGLDLLEIVEERFRQLDELSAAISVEPTAILLVGRGSTHPEANADFFRLGRLLAERLGGPLVECCFVSLAGPAVQDGIERCVRLGARRVLVIPYFLNTGLLVKRIAAQAAESRNRHPDVDIVVGEHMGVHPQLVQLILDRVAGEATGNRQQETGSAPGLPLSLTLPRKGGGDGRTPSPSTGEGGGEGEILSSQDRETFASACLVARYALPPDEIEALSMQRVGAALGTSLAHLPPAAAHLVQRMVYATGDPELATLVRVHPDAIAAGVAALRAGKSIVVDVRMLVAALDRGRAERLRCPIFCGLDAPAVAVEAGAQRLPRALVGMRAVAGQADGGVVVVGTAPTALLALLDLVDAGEVRPALIIGTPVGFVAAAEAKAELAARDVPFITVVGSRGGAAMAAAAANGLLRMAASPAPHASR